MLGGGYEGISKTFSRLDSGGGKHKHAKDNATLDANFYGGFEFESVVRNQVARLRI
jgi:hypothetical protein